jgi:hypothetical protein
MNSKKGFNPKKNCPSRAKQDGEKLIDARLCKRGHDFTGCGKTHKTLGF